jgi:hypothetical protein
VGSAGFALGLLSATTVAKEEAEVTNYVAGWGEGETPSPINNGQAARSNRGWLIRDESSQSRRAAGVLSKVRLAAGVCFADEGARRDVMEHRRQEKGPAI